MFRAFILTFFQIFPKSQYFGLKNAESGDVLHYAPNNWKTEKGALNWAKKNGYKIA